jgi:Ca2+-binding EF-hand superfamily protein
MRCIKEIDKEHNGYVTSTELDDILKIVCKEELKDKNLKAIFKPYQSIANKILIDYKKFRDHLITVIKKLSQIDEEVDKRKKLDDLQS